MVVWLSRRGGRAANIALRYSFFLSCNSSAFSPLIP